MKKHVLLWKPWRARVALARVACHCARRWLRRWSPDTCTSIWRVLIDGQPLVSGNIRCYPESNRAATAKIESDGRFTLSTYEFGDGCVVGRHPVSIMGSKVLNAKTMRWFAPKKYASADTSGLAIDVTEPNDSVEISLTWDGGKPFDEAILGGGEP